MKDIVGIILITIGLVSFILIMVHKIKEYKKDKEKPPLWKRLIIAILGFLDIIFGTGGAGLLICLGIIIIASFLFLDTLG